MPPAQVNNQQPARSVRYYLAEDLKGLNPVVIIPEFEAEHFEVKPVMFNMLHTIGQFGGSVGALNSFRASKDKFEKHMDDMLDVGCLVLATITLELQKLHEYVVSYEMIQNLEEIFEGKARQ
ncbi:hypothetical protein V6N12_045351 [Hibiscus sabdariffa]|uniref:Uncharacterized protein n=1 Tax=Hibiscus sabdariffa TaxID=183260 RepID=A0ABR2G2P2_9ROSI